jgi:ABC-type ATPase with predicted acetyltransferase domain
VKARKASARSAASSSTPLQKPPSEGALPLWSCPSCGGLVTNRLHVRCEACIEADPGQTLEIRGRRGAAIAARKRALSQ